MAILLDGREVALAARERIKKDVLSLKARKNMPIVLASVLVGNNPACGVYVKAQARLAAELGIEYRLFSLEEGVLQSDLVATIMELNTDEAVCGIVLQRPLPASLNLQEALSFVQPSKDAEGLHPQNLGRLIEEEGPVVACTPAACMELLHHYGIKLYGKEAVIVGHSGIVGKPLSLLFLKEFATTTVCHIATSEAGKLEGHLADADIVVAAVGKPNFIKGEWLKDGAIVLDVGINRLDGGIVGDVEFASAVRKASYITPVPGGVGPVTVTILMRNVVELFRQSLIISA